MATGSVRPWHCVQQGTHVTAKCRRAGGRVGACLLAVSFTWAIQQSTDFVASPRGATLNRVAGLAVQDASPETEVKSDVDPEAEKIKKAIVEWETYINDIKNDTSFNPLSYVWAGLTVACFVGLLTILPQLLASSMGVKGAAPAEELTGSLARNTGVFAFFAVLAKWENDQRAETEEVRKQRMLAEGVAGLPLRINGASRMFSDSSSDRVMFCTGSTAFCRSCINSATSSKVLESTNSMLVVMPLTVNLTLDQAALDEFRSNTASSCIGIPDLQQPSPAWDFLCQREFDRAKEQGVGLDFVDDGRAPEGKYDGLSMMFSKDSRMKGRFIGEPIWDELTSMVAQA